MYYLSGHENLSKIVIGPAHLWAWRKQGEYITCTFNLSCTQNLSSGR